MNTRPIDFNVHTMRRFNIYTIGINNYVFLGYADRHCQMHGEWIEYLAYFRELRLYPKKSGQFMGSTTCFSFEQLQKLRPIYRDVLPEYHQDTVLGMFDRYRAKMKTKTWHPEPKILTEKELT